MSRHASQRAARVPEASKLTVTSVDINGKEFVEETETVDISDSGISFYLKSSVWMDAHLTLDIRASSVFGPASVLKAKVVRFGNTRDGRRFTAARFD